MLTGVPDTWILMNIEELLGLEHLYQKSKDVTGLESQECSHRVNFHHREYGQLANMNSAKATE